MTENKSNGGPWYREVIKYGGAVAIIVGMTYFVQTLIPVIRGTDPEMMKLWREQTEILAGVRSLLERNNHMTEILVQKADTLINNARYAIGRQVTKQDLKNKNTQ